jgi:transcriptional regulator with XRE-family HTH domain
LDAINTQVAERLRSLRRAAGLSLEELAGRSGVSRAMLSQIETLKTNPTIAVLWKIAGGLEVSFAELLGDQPAEPVALSRVGDARYLWSRDRSFRSRPLLSHVPGHRVELYELGLEPGGVEQAAAHPAGSFEHLFVTAGRLSLAVGGEEHALGPRDALLFRADRPHRYACAGKRPFAGLSLILYPP